MNLKEEFKALAEIILKGQTSLELVENVSVPYCNIDCNCDTNQSDETCRMCKEQRYDNYDMALVMAHDKLYDNVYEDVYTSYQFHQDERRTCILKKENMYRELENLNNIMRKKLIYPYQYDSENFQRTIKLEAYAQDFFEKLIKEHGLLVNPDILPIKFYLANEDEAENGGEVNTSEKTRQAIVRIYDIDIRCDLNCEGYEEPIYMTIRHEIIHYFLYCGWLKNGDADAVFWALCTLHNAGAYKEMSDSEQQLYDDFMYIYNNVDDLILQHHIKESKERILNYMLRYIGHIPWDVNKEFLKVAEDMYQKLLSGRIAA